LSKTIRTARSRTSGEYLGRTCFFIAPLSQEMEPPANPGRFNPDRRGAHVRWLETLYWPDSAVNFAATVNTSVEHVLPQRADGKWLKDFPEAIHIHSHQFGNLCLIPKSLNEELKNNQYAKKRRALKELGEEYRSARDVAAAAQWNMGAVQARTDRLKSMALKALGVEQA